jgi:putative hydrolase of the HAD superfamily
MLILFDIDETLLDHTAASRSAATILHAKYGAPLGLESFLGKWADALERHYADYLEGKISYDGQRRARVREVIDPSLSDAAADSVFSDYSAAFEEAWRLFPDVLPCLDMLTDFRLGIVSNGYERQQRTKLARTGILHRFEHVVISSDAGCAKPDPNIFWRACTLAGEAPRNTVYVGDRYDVDAQAARAAGLIGVWLDRRHEAGSQHAPPMIRSLAELRPLLAG